MVSLVFSCLFRLTFRRRTCYIGVFLYAVGFVILGVALQDHLNLSALIIGWAIAQAAVLVITVPVCSCNRPFNYFGRALICAVDAYCSDCFPREKVCKIYYLIIYPIFTTFCAYRERSVASSIFREYWVVGRYFVASRFMITYLPLLGFSVAYYQVSWAQRNGALQTIGCEAA